MAQEVDGLMELVASSVGEGDGEPEEHGAEDASGPPLPTVFGVGVGVRRGGVDLRRRHVRVHQRLAAHLPINPECSQSVPIPRHLYCKG
ncbi:MAG: hypothetical protein E6G57_04605 [Actinobacteria bacterium]|nr:MAG: hypothetical protein E6G57_04605 [Actinomycetota bacterium]